MAKKPKKSSVKLNKAQREMGKRNLYILLALAAAGAAFMIIGSTFN